MKPVWQICILINPNHHHNSNMMQSLNRFFEYTVEKLEVPGELLGFESGTGNISIFRWASFIAQSLNCWRKLADYPAMSFFFVCWHSRKWWPPIRGGTLQMLVLWPEKLNQIDSFCKSGILYAWGGPRSIERCKKHGAPPKKIVFPRPICHFLSLSWKVAATNQNKMILAWKVAATNQDKMILAWKVAATNQAKLILAWKVAACLRFSFLQEIFSNRQWFFLVLVGIYEF